MRIQLKPLTPEDREQFIRDNQDAFNYGALVEFGRRDDHFEEPDEIISRETIEHSIDGGRAYRIWLDGKTVGGLIVKVDGYHGDLEILFVNPKVHSQGIGQAAWREVERMFPEVELWETCTPYFEKRNIHFYVNRCGFHIVEFFNKHHPEPGGGEPEGEKLTGSGHNREYLNKIETILNKTLALYLFRIYNKVMENRVGLSENGRSDLRKISGRNFECPKSICTSSRKATPACANCSAAKARTWLK